MIKKTIWITNDGKTFEYEIEAKLREKFDKYKCTACNGTGYKKEKYNTYPNGLPDSGYVYKPGIRKVNCKYCNGTGLTDTLLKPITKVVDYE